MACDTWQRLTAPPEDGTIVEDAIEIEHAASAVENSESVTSIVKANVPAEVGIPETIPVEAFSERPGGRVPDAIENV